MVKAYTDEGDLVLDPMCGSGTTVEAALRLGRNVVGVDSNPNAVLITKDRAERCMGLHGLMQ